MVLREETDSRDEANSILLQMDVVVSDGEGLQFATVTGGDHSKQEGARLRGSKGGPDRRHTTEERS